MARIAAFSLAVVISFALLAGAVAGVDWVIGHASYFHAFVGRGSAVAIAETVSVAVAVWLPIYFGIFAQKKKKEERNPKILIIK